MLIWTQAASEVLREASAKAASLDHGEVHPLHLLWVLAGRTGMDALRQGRNDQDQAKLRFRLERELSRMPERLVGDRQATVDCATPGFKLQRLLLRAAEMSSRKVVEPDEGRVGVEELLRALLQDDPRTAILLRARETMMVATA
jgi:ATP-dependent Clp protease ATP-binding subunit ClpA